SIQWKERYFGGTRLLAPRWALDLVQTITTHLGPVSLALGFLPWLSQLARPLGYALVSLATAVVSSLLLRLSLQPAVSGNQVVAKLYGLDFAGLAGLVNPVLAGPLFLAQG